MAVSGGVIPELTLVVVPPAFDAAVHDSAGVEISLGDGLCAAGQAEYLDGRRTPCRGVVPQLPIGVVTPALAPAAHDAASPAVARGDSLPAAGEADNLDGNSAPVLVGAVAKRPEVVQAPALDAAVDHLAAKEHTCGDGLPAAGEAYDLDGHMALVSRAVSELAVGVAPPALDRAIHDCAGMLAVVRVASCGDGCDPGNWLPHGIDDLNGHVAAIGGTVAELAPGVVPPAPGTAVHDRAGVVARRRYGLYAAGEARDLNRQRARVGGAVAELAAGVVPPALGATVYDSAGVVGTSSDSLHSAGEAGERNGHVRVCPGDVAGPPALDAAVDHRAREVPACGDRSSIGNGRRKLL